MINIDALNDDEKLAALESIHKSIAESKEIQRKKITTNVEMIVKALKKIEADLKQRYDETGQLIANLKNGEDGRDGKDGKDGKNGKDGRDGLMGPRGYDGAKGENGLDGADGVSVTDAHIDFDGSLIIHLSSGRVINVGEVVAADIAEKIKVITNGGGTSQTVIDTLASLQAQITAISAALVYKGTWNASTNTPTLASGVGTANSFYIVSVAGSTTLDGISNWGVGDWAVFNGSVWQRVEGGAVGNFTDLTVTGTTTLSGLTASTALALDASKNIVSVTNTGTGSNVLATSPTLVTPALGTPSSGVVTNLTGTASININGTVGATTASTGNFTTLGATGNVTLGDASTDTLNVGNGGLVKDASGNVGIGTASPTRSLTIDKSGAAFPSASNPSIRLNETSSGRAAIFELDSSQNLNIWNSDTGSGATRFYRGTGSGTLSMILNGSGNVGIGTSSPTSKLTVSNSSNGTTVDVAIANTYYLSGSIDESVTFQGEFYQDDVAANRAAGYMRVTKTGDFSNNANASANLVFATRNAGSITEKMRIDNAGNIGIGTSSPSYTLDVSTGGSSGGVVDGARVFANASGAAESRLIFGTFAASTNAAIGAVTATGQLGSLKFYTATTNVLSEKMRIDSSGNVGIGTTPSFPLDVQSTGVGSTIASRIYRSDGTIALLRIGNSTSGSASNAPAFGSDTTAAVIYTANAEVFRITSAGNVGIGTTTPDANLTVNGAASFAAGTALLPSIARSGDLNTGMWFPGADITAFTQGGSESVRIGANGNVAIGTTSVSEKLTVQGGVLIFGTSSSINYTGLVLDYNSGTGEARVAAGGQSGLSSFLTFTTTLAGTEGERLRIDSSGNVLVTGTGGLGYGTGSGGAVTQATSRTTGVTLNKTNGAITLVSAAGLATFQSFTVTNSTVAATDVVHVTQKSGTDLYQIFVTATAAGSFRISYATTGGTTTEQPVFNFAVLKAVTA